MDEFVGALVSEVTSFASTEVKTMGSKTKSSEGDSVTKRTSPNSRGTLNSKTILYSTIKPYATRKASTLIINMNTYDKSTAFTKSTEPNPSNDSILLSDGSDIKLLLGADNEIGEKITPAQVSKFILLIDICRTINTLRYTNC